MQRPRTTGGLRHVALKVHDLKTCLHFYQDLLGMQIEWQPDEDNVYLTNGNDNLALHKVDTPVSPGDYQALDHIGFILQNAELVEQWYAFLSESGVEMRTDVKHHRDGAVSFYCFDPSGVTVQMIYHPPIA